MALSDILQAMEAAANEEAARLLEGARAEAEELREAAREDGQAARSRARMEETGTAAAERARLQAEAQLRIASKRAVITESLLDEVFAAAARCLEQVRASAGYSSAFARLLAETLAEFTPDEPLVVKLDVRDLPLVEATAGGTGRQLRFDSSLQTWGGVIVEGANGRIVADNTLERRLERARERLSAELVANLFDRRLVGPPPAGAAASVDESSVYALQSEVGA